jgi:hypothetical protein
VVDGSIQLRGRLGVTDEAPLGRFLNEVRVFRIYDGPAETHRSSIARREVRRLQSPGVPSAGLRRFWKRAKVTLVIRRAHALLSAGNADPALVVGFDKHPRGAFNPLPEEWGIGSWYAETGPCSRRSSSP